MNSMIELIDEIVQSREAWVVGDCNAFALNRGIIPAQKIYQSVIRHHTVGKRLFTTHNEDGYI